MKPYIFISYAHKDSKTVLPIIETLKQHDVPIWYDEGIEAGTEWPATIEQKLVNCSAVLVFVSPASVQSQNCRNEINLALSLKKDMLTAYLEETPLGAGMNLQLGTLQAIYRYRHPSNESFCRSLLASEFISQFLPAAPAAPAAPVTAPTAAPARPAAIPAAVANPVDAIAKAWRFSTVRFGNYPQKMMYPEPIQWIVLHKSCGEALLLSKYVLDCRYFGDVFDWENSEMRSWLNGEFAQTAFTAAELAQIDNFDLYTETVEDIQRTTDKVFLLDNRETREYFKSFLRKRHLKGRVTPYAKRKGAYLEQNYGLWWLRSSHYDTDYLNRRKICYHHNITLDQNMCMDPTQNAATVINGMGVRPAIWVRYI